VKRIRLLLVEDNRLLREGITAIIKGQSDLNLVAASGSFENVLPNLQELKPEVILLNLGLRENTLQGVEMVKRKFPEMKVIGMNFLSVEGEDILEFVKAGIFGFIVKEACSRDFLKTIRSVAEGAKVLPPELTGSLFSQIEEAFRSCKVRLNDVQMTRREKEVFDMIAEGLCNKEIAQKLHLATYTVKSHVHNILKKLALPNRLQVAAYAHGKEAVHASE
jgi:DNA-binding NarL/FixJ family response regulator